MGSPAALLMRTPRLVLCALLLGVVYPSMAAADDENFDAVHHSVNGYYLDFLPVGKVELPRIFVVQTESGTGLRTFYSTKSALLSGEFVPADSADAADIDKLIASGYHLDAKLKPRSGSVMLDLSLTRHLVFALLAAALLLWGLIGMARRYQAGIGRTSAPKGLLQNMLEQVIIFVRDDIAKPTLGPEHYGRFLPYLLTVFFFIGTCNFLGLVPWGATASSNINITAALALFTLILTLANGSKSYWKHIFWPPNMPIGVKLLLIPTEIAGIFIKPAVLAIRLFANMTAGHLVILSLIGMIFTFGGVFGPLGGYGVAPVAIGFTLFIYLLEILIALIQAYVFTFLSGLFIGMALEEHEHEAAH